jgi:hypothetical protein
MSKALQPLHYFIDGTGLERVEEIYKRKFNANYRRGKYINKGLTAN